MDLLTHFLWFFVLTYNKHFAKGKKFFGTKWNKTSGFIFAIAPDLALIPYLSFVGYFMLLGKPLAEAKTFPPLWVYSIYQLLHSYLFWFVMGLILFLFARKYFMGFILGWGLHITIDVFLHQGHFANRPLFTLSDLAIKGFFKWEESWVFILINYCIVLMIVAWLFLKKGLTWKKFKDEIF